MAKTRDRRVQRTQQLLEAALLSLIKRKEFDTISVQEIIDEANVGRATFYAHYDNKEDLLESGFNGLLADLQQRQDAARSSGSSINERLFAFSHHLLAHADEHRGAFPSMVSKRGGALIQHLLRHVIVRVVRDDVKAMARTGGTDQMPEDAVVQFIAGGLFGLMMWWLGAKRCPSVEEMGELFRRLALPSVKAAFPS
ncbi:TetR/AcrR family transcriptional regulator [uncultured Paludibaculum sp.]|uniref:TetR/AcrR family transcriptional regulator n=1 Tax=uncultured Paludibaculum sp. TaxID=1765020 RepID=UPI002AAAB5F0|nr:TetR/AcrR family transcriptional regulator [uncultured Paludibaculum sp.]